MNISRLLFSVQILLTYPIECFVTREVIENTILGKDPNIPTSDRIHYLLTLGIVATTYCISITTYCLGAVLELNVSGFVLNMKVFLFLHRMILTTNCEYKYLIVTLLND